jgi:hypothetical protein
LPLTLRPTPLAPRRHPSPLTLRPSPFALHPSPLTLRPSPFALHPSPVAVTSPPSPFAPHPSPHTPRPLPSPSSITPHPSPLIPHPSPLAAVALGLEKQRLLFLSGRYTISSQRSRLGDKVVEAIECLKSWAGEDLCYSTGSNVVDAERMLVDLQRQAEAIAGTTEEE